MPNNISAIAYRVFRSKVIIPFLFSISVLVAFSSCERSDKSKMVSDKDRLIQKIDSSERAIAKMSPTALEEDIIEASMYLATDLQRYTINYPADSISADYAFKMAQLYDIVFKDRATALEYYYQVYQRYKWFDKQDEVLFLIANIYHDANEYQKATMVLERLKEYYPESAYSVQATDLLAIMKTDTSLNATIKRFEKQNAEAAKEKTQ